MFESSIKVQIQLHKLNVIYKYYTYESYDHELCEIVSLSTYNIVNCN